MEELGEDTFPEPAPVTATTVAASTASDTDSVTSETSTLVDNADSSSPVNTVQSLEPPPNDPTTLSSSTTPTTTTTHDDAQKIVTTYERQPMTIPASVHVRITPDNLKDYVGPPIYQKDRMYSTPPPPGVSTGLGYLGNGSGAVMPVEAIVRCCSSPPPQPLS